VEDRRESARRRQVQVRSDWCGDGDQRLISDWSAVDQRLISDWSALISVWSAVDQRYAPRAKFIVDSERYLLFSRACLTMVSTIHRST
jgi:hypothetical protein